MSSSNWDLPKPVMVHAYQIMAHLSPAGQRLFWSLDSPLLSAISVMSPDLNPDAPSEPYLHTDTGKPHLVSRESITENPVSSLAVTEENLRDWRDQWWTFHRECFDEDVQPEPGQEPPVFEPLTVTASNDEFVTIHDYISAVHPWLMGRRDELLRAWHFREEGPDGEVLADMRLLVSAHNTRVMRAPGGGMAWEVEKGV